MRAAHLALQPYFLQLAKMWLPGEPVVRASTSVTSRPLGPNAPIDAVSFSLKEAPPAAS
jgi:hypothetical protein